MFEFHIVEPITHKDTVTLCRPNMLGYVQSKVKDRIKNGPLYMDYEKKKESKEEIEKRQKEQEEEKRKEWEREIRERKKERELKKKEGKKEKVDPKYTKQILDRYTQSAGNSVLKHRTLEVEPYH